MKYSNADILCQLQLGEDSNWEFKQIEFAGNKPKSPKPDDWANEIAAFANADGGTLLCSVSNDGVVQVMTREQVVALEQLLVDVSTDKIKPPVRIRTIHKFIKGERLLLVDVTESDEQHDSSGASYVRVGSSKKKMTNDERLRLAQKRGQARFLWFDGQVVPDTGFRTLDESLWKPLVSTEGAVDPRTALSKLKLLDLDREGIERATVTGILFCTPNPEQSLPNACITATHYFGKDRASGQLDAQEITGPLNKQIAEALDFAVRNMNVAARKEPARQDMPQYSEKAVFEALVNAVAHRDYSIRGSKIRLSMFEDRLELQSPGSLPNNLTVDSMAMRQATRNETLTSILGRMPLAGNLRSQNRRYFMERRGDGVLIIQRETKELCGSRPEFRLVDESELCLTIPAAPLHPWDLFRGGFAKDPAATAIITVRCEGKPLAGADLLVLFPNKTWRHVTTNDDGEGNVDLHSHVAHLPMTVFVAAHGYTARLERDWVPAQRPLAVDLEALPEGGSIILPEAIGNIPGLMGRLNPIRDPYDRTYLYATNIAINEGQQQPVHFIPGEKLRLTDLEGNELQVRIIDIVGRSALVEYRSYPVESVHAD